MAVVDRGEDDMGRHRERHVGQCAKRGKIMGGERLARRADARQFQMAVGSGTAMAGNMLDDGKHAAGDEPLRGRPAADRDRVGRVPVGPVRDHRIGAGNGNIEHRKAIDRDAERSQVMRDEARPEPDGGAAQQEVGNAGKAPG